MAALSHRLGNADRCWTSPSLRSRQTAEALGLTATIDPMLRECDYGGWTGLSIVEVQTQDPEALAEWTRDPAVAPHGGESIINLMQRVATWLDGQNQTVGKTVAVTHASVIRAAIVHAIGAAAHSFWRVDVPPLSLTQLSGTHGRWTLTSLGPMQAQQA